jgi:hypothetical protein
MIGEASLSSLRRVATVGGAEGVGGTRRKVSRLTTPEPVFETFRLLFRGWRDRRRMVTETQSAANQIDVRISRILELKFYRFERME